MAMSILDIHGYITQSLCQLGSYDYTMLVIPYYANLVLPFTEFEFVDVVFQIELNSLIIIKGHWLK